MAVGDVDGDGKLDLVVANSGSTAFPSAPDTLSVLVNSGTGTFAPKVDYPTGSNPVSVAVGDVNGDGKSDLVVANFNGSTVSVLLNSGTGTFAPKVDYPAGDYPRSVAVGDVNGDGKPDLVVANSGVLGSTVSVLVNSGTGTFAPKVDYPTGAGPYSGGVGRRGRGRQARPRGGQPQRHGGGTVSVLVNSGTGTFAPKVDYPTGINPSSVALGDVDGDGKTDIVVANAVSGTVSVLVNSGTGTFAPKVDYPPGGSPVSVAVGDVNGDGKLDLVVAGPVSVSVLVNSGPICGVE